MASNDLHDLAPAKVSDLISMFPLPHNHLVFIQKSP